MKQSNGTKKSSWVLTGNPEEREREVKIYGYIWTTKREKNFSSVEFFLFFMNSSEKFITWEKGNKVSPFFFNEF